MTSDLADYSVIVFERTGYDTYACRALILALLHRHMRDLHNAARRDCALRWFECGEARLWCGLSGLPLVTIFQRVEQELDRAPIRYRRRRRVA